MEAEEEEVLVELEVEKVLLLLPAVVAVRVAGCTWAAAAAAGGGGSRRRSSESDYNRSQGQNFEEGRMSEPLINEGSEICFCIPRSLMGSVLVIMLGSSRRILARGY